MLPDAQPFVSAYAACATQWNYAGMGERSGLRYEGCMAVLTAYLPTWQADPAFAGLALDDLLSGVRIIERSLLDCDAEARAKRSAERPPPKDPTTRLGG